MLPSRLSVANTTLLVNERAGYRGMSPAMARSHLRNSNSRKISPGLTAGAHFLIGSASASLGCRSFGRSRRMSDGHVHHAYRLRTVHGDAPRRFVAYLDSRPTVRLCPSNGCEDGSALARRAEDQAHLSALPMHSGTDLIRPMTAARRRTPQKSMIVRPVDWRARTAFWTICLRRRGG